MFAGGSEFIKVGQYEEGSEKAAPETKQRYEKGHDEERAPRKERVKGGTDPHSHGDQQRRGLNVVLNVLCYKQRHEVQNNVEKEQETGKNSTTHHLSQTREDQGEYGGKHSRFGFFPCRSLLSVPHKAPPWIFGSRDPANCPLMRALIDVIC